MLLLPVFLLLVAGCRQSINKDRPGKTALNTTLTRQVLEDKIKGGWTGQVIGCTFGGPTEFRFQGTMIQDYQPIPWDKNTCKWWYENAPGLYDDVYMDLTFVDVMEKEGIDAPASAHANAFAHAKYNLWHANQAARYNILNGIMPPASGYWENNPHSDDIDFQIEADFAGLMSPGMVNTANEIADKVGHIMNYGDGWYGGVFVASMYALAFVSDDIPFIVNEALKAIPENTTFYQCIADVIRWHDQYPGDWKQTWFETQKKWSSDIGCPDGVFTSFDIDAKLNSAYVVIGLLYGEGDYAKTLEIATRCGEDSDCNPATAGGILGTVLGYDRIPDFWKDPVLPVEDMDFKYTTMSLNDVYETGTRHALEMLKRNGATFAGDTIEIPFQEIKPVKLEQGFTGHFPKERKPVGRELSPGNPEISLNFTGKGFVLTGRVKKLTGGDDKVLNLEMVVDDQPPVSFTMPSAFATRRHEVAWKYNLEEKAHTLTIRLLNPDPDFSVAVNDLLVYSGTPQENAWKINIHP